MIDEVQGEFNGVQQPGVRESEASGAAHLPGVPCGGDEGVAQEARVCAAGGAGDGDRTVTAEATYGERNRPVDQAVTACLRDYLEPWKAEPRTGHFLAEIVDRVGMSVLTLQDGSVDLECEADYLRRVAACVNAMRGQTTERVEQMAETALHGAEPVTWWMPVYEGIP